MLGLYHQRIVCPRYKLYLKCLYYILIGLFVPHISEHPEIQKFPGREIRPMHDLRRIIKVPLRTIYNYGKFIIRRLQSHLCGLFRIGSVKRKTMMKSKIRMNYE
jgi:hypothetical protein